jgi:hypothetical protein
MPAPPPESEPAIERTAGGVLRDMAGRLDAPARGVAGRGVLSHIRRTFVTSARRSVTRAPGRFPV